MNATDQRAHTTKTQQLEARLDVLEQLVAQLLDNDNVLLPAVKQLQDDMGILATHVKAVTA